MTYALAEFKKITFGSAAQDRGGIMVHGQRAQISGEVYEATLPNIHGQELVFQLLKQQYPGMQPCTLAGPSCTLRYHHPAVHAVPIHVHNKCLAPCCTIHALHQWVHVHTTLVCMRIMRDTLEGVSGLSNPESAPHPSPMVIKH